MNIKIRSIILFAALCICSFADAQLKPEVVSFKPFVWKSEIPKDCPFEQSRSFTGIKFLGLESGYHYGDTWYPSWASNDTLYTPWTDGTTKKRDGSNDATYAGVPNNTTGEGVMVGDDPLTIQAYSIGTYKSLSEPYHSRYPCGTLIYNGVWYYGTYCLDPAPIVKYGNTTVNWPWMGPFVGFRYSTDYGKTWHESPRTPAKPLFGETGMYGYPVKIGAPHFVDFGKNMQYSPDGKAYLVAHGADTTKPKSRFWNDSYINGDYIYLLRVTPGIENMNDSSKYEFYAGKAPKGNPIWTHDFKKIKPLLEWDNNMGSVTITYDAPLKKYFMFITDGGNTVSKMNTFVLESDKLTGKWKLVTYMKHFGEQGYFINIPSKFISKDGKTAWLLYSANYWPDKNIKVNPPGSHYGIVFQKIEFVNNSK